MVNRLSLDQLSAPRVVPSLSGPPVDCRTQSAQQMPVQRKTFRIEQTTPVAIAADALDGAAISPAERQEIVAELRALHALMERRTPASATNSDACTAEEYRKLRAETDAIHLALTRTKEDIASLHVNAFGPPSARMTRELDA